MVWFHIVLGTSVAAIIFMIFAVLVWAGYWFVRDIRLRNEAENDIEDEATQACNRGGHEPEMVCNVDSEIK